MVQQQDTDRAKRHAMIDEQLRKKKARNKLLLFGSGIGAIILVVVVVVNIFSSSSEPGLYDDFAKCLTEKGVVMYGAIQTCTYTQTQAAMFGNSFKYVNYSYYRDYAGQSRISKTPTWFISGARYEGVLSFQQLSRYSGCNIE